MKKLLKNGRVVNVFTDQIMNADVLMENDRIIGVGSYPDTDADEIQDVAGRFLCPGFIDGHIHIESTMLSPTEFSRVCLPHGTTTVIADPHEIANVSGLSGIEYMLQASKGVPMNICFMVPSCVPATGFDESGACLTADDISSLLPRPRILGLAEMMNYPGVLFGDKEALRKIDVTRKAGMIINGHAPMLSGHDLDRYIAAGIFDEHECTSFEEALEKLQKGQWIMIRQGSAAGNLESLLPLFDEPLSRRCLLVTDDVHTADLMQKGHIDHIIRMAAAMGKSVLTGIRMATLQAALRFGLTGVGAVAPGYTADLLVLDDLDTVQIRDVYYHGSCVVKNGVAVPFPTPTIRSDTWNTVRNSFQLDRLTPERFRIEPQGSSCRVIRVFPNQLITGEEIRKLDFTRSNGIDLSNDILKLAVIERHHGTDHIGLGFVVGMGLKAGAIASSVAHDSHNLIVAGTNETDMAAAANCVRDMGGGLAVVRDGQILASMALSIGGLMSEHSAAKVVCQHAAVRKMVDQLGHAEKIDPITILAFVSLPVIPDLKLTTLGLVNVNEQKLVPLFVQ